MVGGRDVGGGGLVMKWISQRWIVQRRTDISKCSSDWPSWWLGGRAG